MESYTYALESDSTVPAEKRGSVVSNLKTRLVSVKAWSRAQWGTCNAL